MLNPSIVDMIQGLAHAAHTLSGVTGSDDQTKHILCNISELANPPTVTSVNQKPKSPQGESSRVVVYDKKGTKRMEGVGKATWYLDADGTLHINEVEVVDTVKRPSIEERTRNMDVSNIIALAKVMAQQPDTTVGELEQLAKLTGRNAAVMLF